MVDLFNHILNLVAGWTVLRYVSDAHYIRIGLNVGYNLITCVRLLSVLTVNANEVFRHLWSGNSTSNYQSNYSPGNRLIEQRCHE